MVGTHVTLALATAFRAKHTFAKFAQCPAVSALLVNSQKKNPLKYYSHVHTCVLALCFRLKVKSAKLSDSGNYSCLPTTAEGDSVTVHIINGKCAGGQRRDGGGWLKTQKEC